MSTMTKKLGYAISARPIRYVSKNGTRSLKKGTTVYITGIGGHDKQYLIEFWVGRWKQSATVTKTCLKDIYLYPVKEPVADTATGGPKAEEQKPLIGDRASRDEGKLKYSLVDYPSMEGMTRVLMFGAKKYAPYNWQKGMPVNELLESMQRHLAALMAGEDRDPESGEFHEDHIHCNAMFLSWMRKYRPDMDDRVKGPNAPLAPGSVRHAYPVLSNP